MEMFNLGIKMEKPNGDTPEGLKRDVTVDLVK
jgi:hypothetical protein